MKRKALVIIALVIGSTLVFMAGVSYGISSIRLIVNGKDIAADVPPFIQNSRTFVPIRFVAEALGYPVSYDGTTKTVYVGIPPEGVDLDPYSTDNCNTLSLSSPATVGGVKYSKGFVILGGAFMGSAKLNLAGHYTTINLSLGVPDNINGDETSKIIAYGDGKEIGVFEVKPSDLVKDFTLDVQGINQVMLKIDWFNKDVAVINVRGIK